MLLQKREILARLLQYVIPEFHQLSLAEVMEQIKKVTPCKKGEYESFLESRINGKKALFIIAIGYGDEREPDRSSNKCSGCRSPLCEVNERKNLAKPELIHLIQLCPDALDRLIGHDRIDSLVTVPLDQKGPMLQRYDKSGPLDLTFVYFNQNQKLDGIHRLLQIIFSDNEDKQSLLKTEFNIDFC